MGGILKILDLNRRGAVILYADEAVVTSSTQATETWMIRNSSFKIKKVSKLSFDAVAAVAGIDGDGRLVDYVLSKGAITIPTFLDFIEKIGNHYQGKKVYLFLDNLILHHKKQVALRCERLNVKIIFNAKY